MEPPVLGGSDTGGSELTKGRTGDGEAPRFVGDSAVLLNAWRFCSFSARSARALSERELTRFSGAGCGAGASTRPLVPLAPLPSTMAAAQQNTQADSRSVTVGTLAE